MQDCKSCTAADYGWAAIHGALAVSDVFLVKSLCTAGFKIVLSEVIIIEEGGEVAGDAAAKGESNVVYRSVENGVTIYVGITNNIARREAEQLAAKGIKIVPLLKGLSRADARAVEQALIKIHGLGKNGGTLLIMINSISPTRPFYAAQLKRGYELLKSIGY